MLLSKVFTCFKSENVEYSHLSDVELEKVVFEEYKRFNILDCRFISRTASLKNLNQSYIEIQYDSIKLDCVTLKFEYLMSFNNLNQRDLCIKILGKLNKTQIEICDSALLLIIKFPSSEIRKEFMSHLLEIIQVYKTLNIFDKSILKYKHFGYKDNMKL